MPVTLSQLKANTRTIVVPYEQDEVRLTYQPSQMTPVVESEINAASRDGDVGPMLQAMSKLIVEWDVMEDDKKALPHTVEVLAGLPNAFLMAIFRAIQEDMAPKARAARSSFAR